MKKPNITGGKWYLDKCETPNSLECLKGRCLGSICTTEEYEWELCAVFSDADQKHEANAKAISAVPDMINALLETRTQLTISMSHEHAIPTKVLIDWCIKVEKALESAGCEHE